MKPNAALIQEALVLVDAGAAEAAMVGDSVTDVEAARAVGVRCIGLANRPCETHLLREAGPEAVIEHMAELL
jgi:phosphoglycolate phosphatase-like HAD superfamily hydrolase